MQAKLKLLMPNDLQVKIEVIGSIKDFKAMEEQLQANTNRTHWPLADFAYAVRDAIKMAEKEWVGDSEDQSE